MIQTKLIKREHFVTHELPLLRVVLQDKGLLYFLLANRAIFVFLQSLLETGLAESGVIAGLQQHLVFISIANDAVLLFDRTHFLGSVLRVCLLEEGVGNLVHVDVHFLGKRGQRDVVFLE